MGTNAARETYLNLIRKYRSLGCENEALCTAACQVYIELSERKRHEDVQYHFNEKHGIIFLTAVDSVHHRKRVGPNACDTENIKTGGENVHSTSPTAQSLSQVTVDATTTSASSNISHVDPEEKQTKIYIPHVVSHDINMMQLYQIQSDLFHWAQENLQNPPENEHVVLAIVDPSFTIVYYKLTKGMLNLQ